MTAQELQKRNERAQQLRVIQVDDHSFFVESSEGKICYKVMISDGEVDCTCGDFARNSRTDPHFRCKHIMAVENCLPAGQYETARFLEKKKPKLDERFIIELEGKEFVTYPGLLDLGHQKGILKIEVDPIQLPTKDNGNFAICKALVISKTGETFIDVGDANPANCNSRVAKHLLRMASTRSIARALRSFTNIGMTCLEELADFDDVIGEEGAERSKPKPRRRTGKRNESQEPSTKEKPSPPAREKQEEESSNAEDNKAREKDQPSKPQASKPKKGNSENESKGNGGNNLPRMSEAQKRAIYNLSRRRGISVDNLENMTRESYGVSLEELSSRDASQFIRQLQQAA